MLGDRLEASATSPEIPFKGHSDTHKLYVSIPHIKNIWSNCSHIPCNCLDCYFDPWYYVEFYYHSLHLPTVEGCWLQFSVAPALPFTAAQFALSDPWCHPPPLTELISLGLPLQVSPLALTQPYWLLSWVEGTLSLYHHICSTWNQVNAFEANERGDHLSVFESCLCSTS